MSKHTSLLIIAIILLQANTSFAKIIETSDSSVIRKKMFTLTENDLLIFDVKGVVYTPKDQILSPDHVLNSEKKSGK